MKKIFEIDDLTELREYLSDRPDVDELREELYSCFLKYSQYENAVEWNRAVRVCEALAIIGWGTYEPVEAIKGVYFNGDPETYFINRHATPRFFNAVWSKRKDGVAIDYGLSFFHGTHDNPLSEPIRLSRQVGESRNVTLCSQRNWIPKNPIRIVRGIANCYKTSESLIESIEKELIPELDKRMRPELYGAAIDTIILNLSFSFYDNYHCKTNYIIADEALKLKSCDLYSKLREMYSEKEIEDNGYYLRPRFSFGPFRSATGTIRVNIVFEKEFSLLSVEEQKHLFGEFIIQAVEHVVKRLERKIDYALRVMNSDFRSIVVSWCRNDFI